MVRQLLVEPEDSGSNPAVGEFFCTILQPQGVTSNRVYKIRNKGTYDQISVYTA